MTLTALQSAQMVAGVVLVAYAIALLAQRARHAGWRLPRWPSRTAPQTDDLRLLIEMAARFRDSGNPEAVRACQALIDQLLNPKPTPEALRVLSP